MNACPVPGCGKALSRGAVFCVDHHFALDAKEARFLIGFKARTARMAEGADKTDAEQRLQSYTRNAIRKIMESKSAA